MFYRLFVGGIFVFYTLAAWNGWEMGTPRRGVIPREARQQSGGYRSYHYWRGGK
jgi:hypothetical protein